MTTPEIGTPPSARTRYLILALRDTTLRSFVANIIAQERPADMATPLADLLTDRSDFLRATAAQLLGSLNDVPPDVRQRLAQAGCEDDHPIVRQNAQESLWRLTHSAAVETVA